MKQAAMNLLTVYEIAGLCITILSTIAAYIRSSADARKQNAALVSLLGVVFTILTTMRFDWLPKIEKHLATAESLSKNRELLPLIDKIAGAQQLQDSAHPLMSFMLKQRFQSLEDQFDKMSQGKFMVDESEMPGFALELIKSAKKKILATSYVQVAKWWETPWGKQYEDLNEKKVKNGVSITRIFIFSSKEDFQRIEDLMRKQKAAGIDVRYAYTADLSYKVTSDMIVIDDGLSGELRLTPDKGMTLAEFMTRPADITEIQRRIAGVEVQSSQYDRVQ